MPGKASVLVLDHFKGHHAVMEACGIGILTVAELRLVHISSAVALQVLGTLHQIPLVITGVVWFQDPAPELDLQRSFSL